MKYRILLASLLVGCAHTETKPTKPLIAPINPPLFDVTAIKQQLIESQKQAIALRQFVVNSGGLYRLQSSIDIYLVSAQNLYDEIVYAPPAQVSYQPWQIQR